MKMNSPPRMMMTMLILGLVLWTVTGEAVSAEKLTDEEKAQANNPLAATSALNFQNFYAPALYGVPDMSINTMWIRTAFPAGRTLTRASLPLATRPYSGSEYKSGLGDFNVFTAYMFLSNSKTNLGVGPLLVAPTATEDVLGQDKWQLGAAAIVFMVASPALQVGGLLTWQTSIAGNEDRPETSIMAMQPFAVWQLGGGKYLRSTATWTFDLRSGHYAMPIGMGIGQVARSGKIIYNLFLEPQFTFLQNGTGQPEYQIFLGLHLQFAPLRKK